MFLKIVSILSVFASVITALYFAFRLLGKQEKKSGLDIDVMFWTIFLIIILALVFIASIAFMLNTIK
jgi:hypothetical protein